VNKKKIKELILDNSVKFMSIQETKIEVVTNSLCYNIWGNDDFSWMYLLSEVNSRGILSLLCK